MAYAHVSINSTRAVRRPPTTDNECLFSRSAGGILLLCSIISFVINLHSLRRTRQSGHVSSRDRNLVRGMFLSSLCVIIISVPSVVAQCFRCDRLPATWICQVEGFNSFLNGCTAMYMLVALSLVRYSTTANSSFSTYMQHQIKDNSAYLVILSFALGSVWAVPPLFKSMSAYVHEGLGFHCGLDWFDRSWRVRGYFFLLFICVYFIPLTIIVYVNIYIQRTVYRLTHLNHRALLKTDDPSDMRRHISDPLYEKEMQRLNCLHEDRRFVVATGICVMIYLVAWTPYSCVAISQVLGNDFFSRNLWMMTTCALLAKMSMITNPIIYTILLKGGDTAVVAAKAMP